MADYSEGKSAAELQREIEMQRHRVEDTIDQIQEKLSPGQLVDELLNYTKSGGGEFLSNLTHSVSRNPLPVALLGVSLVWLIARPGGDGGHRDTDREWDRRLSNNSLDNSRQSSYAGSGYVGAPYGSSYGSGAGVYDPYDGADDDYPTTSVQGSVLQRLGHVTDDGGQRYAEFVDDAGKKFRALTDDAGNRAGHFMDEAGNRFRGFTDSTGNQIGQFRDEAGNLLEEASGWASHTWAMANRRLHDAADAIASGVSGVKAGLSGVAHGAAHLTGRASDMGGEWSGRAGRMGGRMTDRAGQFGGQLSNRAGQVGGQVQHQADIMARNVQNILYEQPLVGGAVAFAVGAALGSALPHTRQEDQLMGEAADSLKGEAAHRAAELYEKGKEQVGTMYESAQEKAAEVYSGAKEGLDHVKDEIASSLSSATSTDKEGGTSTDDADATVSRGTSTTTGSTRTAY